MHRTLARQLRKLGLTQADLPSLGAWRSFVEQVSAIYQTHDDDRDLIERAMAVSSGEMRALMDALAERNAALKHEIDRHSATAKKLEYAATHDQLTGLPSRAVMLEELGRCLKQGGRGGGYALLFIDLDDFKGINDTYGHTAGDQVLKEMGWLLDSQQSPGHSFARASDIAARYGGEEFALILPDTSMDGALSAAERVRHRVTTLPLLPELAALRNPPLTLTCSIGVASFPIHASTAAGLVAAADAAVYAAKRAGKNCVRMATPVSPAPLVGS